MWDLTFANFVVQFLILLGLLWYASETRRIRSAAQEQIVVSREQLEALQKPCITLVTMPRAFDAALLDMNDAVGTMDIPFGGNVELRNIGSGPAFNVRYQLKQIESSDSPAACYIPYIPTGEKASIPVPTSSIRLHQHELLILYESLSGTRYETNIRIHNGTLTDARFLSK